MKSIIILSLIVLIVSCTNQKEIQRAAYPDLFDGKYDSEFPYKSSSEQLEKISNTIRLVNSITFYKTFYFDYNQSVTINNIRNDTYEQKAYATNTLEKTASGTGTIIYNRNNIAAVLTCSHIVSFPDSVVTYHKNSDGKITGIIESISIIRRRNIYFVPFPGGGDMELILDNPDLDIAVLKTELPESYSGEREIFNYKLGNASELDWGSFVYAFGFPLNNKMITKGIVSNPNNDGKGSFLIDAVFNRGFSGGIVLAIRDGVPNFELVGMIKSVPAKEELYLRPETDGKTNNYLIGSEYKGDIYVDSRTDIKYGITKVLSIEMITKFLRDNSPVLQSNKIDPELLFK